ncbi:MAG TPA: hypothetical protein VGR45_09100 [Stellaceae bacterium]|nr:hypothetical protein [Stellaceae bacterium]
MVNSDIASGDDDAIDRQDAAVNEIVRSGVRGAAVLAGLATLIVVAIWFAFYLLVFVPRAVAP